MKMEDLQKQLEMGDIAFHGNCHDCKIPVKVICKANENGEIVISGGAVYNMKIGTPSIERKFFKCNECFQKDNILRNYQPCEVYSRVVGYIRPVKQWNRGKIEEFKQRKEFVVEREKIGGDIK